MRIRLISLFTFVVSISALSFASAYNGRPKLVVMIVVDQFRGDYLERYRDQFSGGFHMLLERGADFTDCYYDYANTRTAPGHATLATGAYTNGHGIGANEWWDPVRGKVVTSVEDESTTILGGSGMGASPHNLRADTIGDELRLATQGAARVFGISLKDRSAILPTGFAANAAYWIDKTTGAFETSSYYMQELPAWVKDFNGAHHAEKYLNREWKDASGKVLRTTEITRNSKGLPADYYDVVGLTPYGTDYQLDFARELIEQEKIGSGPATDLLVISVSSTDILGHKVGADSPEMKAMILALDGQLGDFFSYLGRQIGLANVWIAVSSDHGIVPLPEASKKLHMPGGNFNPGSLLQPLRAGVRGNLAARSADFVKAVVWPFVFLSEQDFRAANLNEADAERMVGEALLENSFVRGYHTRAQLESGNVPADDMGRKYLHSHTPYGGWYVMAVPTPFMTDYAPGVDHLAPYSYDTHAALIFYGLPFQAGTYRTPAEPVDLAVTLASLLGINKPSHAVGRVLTEALAQPQAERASTGASLPLSPQAAKQMDATQQAAGVHLW